MSWKGNTYPEFDTSPSGPVDDPGLSPLYDARTGEMFWYTEYKGRWWDHDIGHLQQRLPAAANRRNPGGLARNLRAPDAGSSRARAGPAARHG
ncbi:MAG: hypothetical protein OXI10_12405 [Gammaproteobacteria bacterium]|nr:hypothetical protein [Gammaproteobacteria bacterium]